MLLWQQQVMLSLLQGQQLLRQACRQAVLSLWQML
jgi:hypothetical protein